MKMRPRKRQEVLNVQRELQPLPRSAWQGDPSQGSSPEASAGSLPLPNLTLRSA